MLPIYGGYDPSSLRMLMEGVPTYPRSITVTNDKLGEEFAGVMGKRAALMRGHGITTCGVNVEDAALTAIKLNHLAELNFRAYQLGDPEPIPDEDIAAFGKSKVVKVDTPVWNYYCQRVGEKMVEG